MKKAVIILFLSTFSMLIGIESHAQNPTAYINAQIYTSNPEMEWAEAMLVVNGKITKIGTTKAIKRNLPQNAVLQDMKGKFVMAGLIDAHVHPTIGGSQALFYCKTPWSPPADTLRKILLNYLAEKKPKVLYGGQWSIDFFNQNPQITNPKEWLDSFIPDIPVVLQELTLHSAWLNSKALAMLKIDKNTPSPAGGTYNKDKKGELNGILEDQAALDAAGTLAQFTDAETKEIINWSQNEALSFGVTALKEAIVDEKTMRILMEMDKQNALKLYYAGCIKTAMAAHNQVIDPEPNIALSKKYHSPNTNFNFIKFFMDGVPTSARTAAMLEAYTISNEHPKPMFGAILVPEEVLFQEIKEYDAQNMVVKIHCAGDSAIKVAINAIEKVRKANGNMNNHHELAHTSFIAPNDRLRLKKLNIVAELSPYIWFPSPLMDNIGQNVGKKEISDFLPIHSLDSLGIMLAAGSDWPAVTSSMNPWIGIEAMVTRKDPTGQFQGVFIPSQALDLKRVIKIFTVDNAHALKKENEMGMLKTGYKANFIVLDKNIFNIQPEKINEIKVLETYYNGKNRFKLVNN